MRARRRRSGALPPAPLARSRTAAPRMGQRGNLSPTLSWGASTGAASYEYCYDTTNDAACSAWTSSGANTSAALSGLTAGTTYYWQVRANNGSGTTYAEGAASAFWSFVTTAPPGAFGHSSPSNGATGQSLNPTLAWTASAGAASYEYCYDTSNPQLPLDHAHMLGPMAQQRRGHHGHIRPGDQHLGRVQPGVDPGGSGQRGLHPAEQDGDPTQRQAQLLRGRQHQPGHHAQGCPDPGRAGRSG